MAGVITAIGTVLTAAIGWVGDVVSAMFGAEGALKDLLPFLAIGMGITLLGIGVGYVRSFVRIKR